MKNIFIANIFLLSGVFLPVMHASATSVTSSAVVIDYECGDAPFIAFNSAKPRDGSEDGPTKILTPEKGAIIEQASPAATMTSSMTIPGHGCVGGSCKPTGEIHLMNTKNSADFYVYFVYNETTGNTCDIYKADYAEVAVRPESMSKSCVLHICKKK